VLARLGVLAGLAVDVLDLVDLDLVDLDLVDLGGGLAVDDVLDLVDLWKWK
jgi:hypothetical protein